MGEGVAESDHRPSPAIPTAPITRETKRAHLRGLPGWRQAVEEGRQMGGPRRQVHVTGVFQRPRDWRERVLVAQQDWCVEARG